MPAAQASEESGNFSNGRPKLIRIDTGHYNPAKQVKERATLNEPQEEQIKQSMSDTVTRHELDAHLSAIRAEMSSTLAQMRSDNAEFKAILASEVSSIKSGISEMKSYVTSEVSSIRGDIAGAKGETIGLKGEISGVRHSIDTIKWFVSALIAAISIVAGVAYKSKPEFIPPTPPVVATPAPAVQPPPMPTASLQAPTSPSAPKKP